MNSLRPGSPGRSAAGAAGWALVAVAGLLPGAGMAAVGGGSVDFNQEIRPILNAHCTGCHGGVKQAGNVSFIDRDKALGTGKSGKATIVAGRPEASELIRRITTTDEDDRMPPASHGEGKRLTAGEVATLRRWIESGAGWGGHWSHGKPVATPPPAVRDSRWPRQTLDHYILARLDAAGLTPAREADRAQWLRRVTFDLTGLPPTPGELQTFAADTAPGAHARVVDRLLSSKAYGERWTALWMDLARYADTQGYEKDNPREIWPYRDWLIRAFNSDLPFDEFTVRQIAGDLLPDASLDDLVATGFHRNTQTNTEGGTDDEEFRLAAVMDRVNTTWTVWQATTFGCVQCHSHPYEPLRHDEYYRFLAFFNNTEDADLGDDFPRLRVPKDPARFAEARRLDVESAALRSQLNEAGRALAERESWQPVGITRVSGAKAAQFTIKGNEVVVDGTVGNGTEYAVDVTATNLTALRLDILPRRNDPKAWPENGVVISHLWLEIQHPPGWQPAVTNPVPSLPGKGSGKPAPAAKPGVELVEFNAIYADTLTGPFDPEESLRAGMAGGGAFPKIFGPRWLVFAARRPVTVPAGAKLRVHIKHEVFDAETKGAILHHFKLAATTNTAWPALVTSPERIDLVRRRDSLQQQRRAIPTASTLVAQERPAAAARETRRFIRGSFLTRDEVVSPGVPAIFPPLAADRPPDRLAAARWLVSPENPLTARVMVNRVWAELFGIGIVETVEDFGSTGEAPSHPELLDHLALRFQGELRWSLKALLREMVLSATYLQDHRATPGQASRDPRNRLLSRGPRTRLTAEMVRDQALSAAGVLSAKIGGPSVMPPQPDGVWQVVYSGAKWETPKGEDRHRRGLYTYWRRTSPYPSFMTFDASSREVCTARRLVTNTPLQALVTLNDPVYFEAAQQLARRMRAQGADPRSRIAWGWRAVTSEAAGEDDLARLVKLFHQAGGLTGGDPDPELAALTLVASTILNCDEALTK